MLSPTTDPTRSQLRVFALTSLVVGAVIAVIGSRWIAAPLLLTGLVGTAMPLWVGGTYRAAMFITRPIGFVVSQIMLAVLYFLVVVPIAGMLRLTGYDPLQRKSPGQWIAVDRTAHSRRRYLRQY